MATWRDPQAPCHVQSRRSGFARSQSINVAGIYHDPGSDHADRFWIGEAIWCQAQLESPIVVYDRMTGVVTAIEPGDDMAYGESMSTIFPLASSPH